MHASVFQIIWIVIVSGVVGTLGMSGLLWTVNFLGIAQVDLIRVLGSLVTKQRESSFSTGLMLHFFWGIFFAIFYTLAIILYNLHDIFSTTVVGFLLSLVHGFVAGMLLAVVVAEHHPVEEYRRPGMVVIIAYMAAHAVYGTLAGFVVGLIGY